MYILCNGGNYFRLLVVLIVFTIILLACESDANEKEKTPKKGKGKKKSKGPNPKEFIEKLEKAKNIVVLTSAEISEESGINTTDATGGSWQHPENLTDVLTFYNHPSLVWEYFNYRREMVLSRKPNKVHYAIAALEKSLEGSGKNFTVITSTVDGYHTAAGSKNVIELFGSLLKTECTKCLQVNVDRKRPICEGLKGRGDADYNDTRDEIPIMYLPRCKNVSCGGLLRPYIYGVAGKFKDIRNLSESILDQNEACILVGTSYNLHDAEVSAIGLHYTGRTVAHFTSEESVAGYIFPYYFRGNITQTVPEVLGLYNNTNT